MPPAPSRLRRLLAVVIGVAFVLTPVATLGFGTPFAFGLAAAYLRSRWLVASSLAYAAVLAVEFSTRPNGPYPHDAIFGTCILILTIGGGIHAGITSRWLVKGIRRGGLRRGDEDLIEAITDDERAAIASDPVLREALQARERRRRSRAIVATDPALADELGIGRPDRTRRFDDGGLVDVNRVPASVLAQLPGFDGAMVDRVISARERFSGLQSGADLVVHADVPNEVVERLSDRLLFRAP